MESRYFQLRLVLDDVPVVLSSRSSTNYTATGAREYWLQMSGETNHQLSRYYL